MKKKLVYSAMGLAAMPVGVINAAVVTKPATTFSQQSDDWTNASEVSMNGQNLIISSTGATVEYSIGKLKKGKYVFTGKLTSTLYNVDVTIGGETQTLQGTDQAVSISFTLSEEQEVTLTLKSEALETAYGNGAEFTLGSPVLNLSFDFAEAKATLTANIEAVITKLDACGYAAKEEDVEAANTIKTNISKIKESYSDYESNELYDLANCPIQKSIDQLSAKVDNEQAYYEVNEQITAMKLKSHEATTTLQGKLTGAAQYLLANAQAKMAAINDRLNVATNANNDSYAADKAATDKATNIGKIPTEAEIQTIVDNYTGQATDNINAYNALAEKVNTLQTNLDNVTIDKKVEAKLADQKDAAQAAIKNIWNKVGSDKISGGAYNSAAQLELDIDSDVAAAQALITKLQEDAEKALQDYDADQANTDAHNANVAKIDAVQKELDNATATLNAALTEGYKPDYSATTKAIQAKIDALTEAAQDAYENRKATDYTPETESISDEISTYKTNAVAAAKRYAELQEAIASYTADLNAARAAYEKLPIYKADGYNYYDKLNVVLKDINDLSADVAATLEKTDAEHYNAVLALDVKAEIGETIKQYADEKDDMMHKYTAEQDQKTVATLEATITELDKNYEEYNLGVNYTEFKGKLDAIRETLATTKAAIEAGIADYTNMTDEQLDEWANTLNELKTQLDDLDKNAKPISDQVIANKKALDALTTNVGTLQTSIQGVYATYDLEKNDDNKKSLGLKTDEIKNEEDGIKTAADALQEAVAGVNADALSVDHTDKVDTDASAWGGVVCPGDNTLAEVYGEADAISATGTLMSQTITGLDNGVYNVVLCAAANYTSGRGFDSDLVDGATDVAYLFANDIQVPVVAHIDGGNYDEYTLENVVISDGTLKLGLAKAKAGTNWHTIQIKSLTRSTADVLDSLNATYNDLAKLQTALEENAKSISEDVAKNESAKTEADKQLTSLQTYYDEKVPGLTETGKGKEAKKKRNDDWSKEAKSRGVIDSQDWTIYPEYDAEAKVITDSIAKLTQLVNDAYAAETLNSEWSSTLKAQVENTTGVRKLVDAMVTKAAAEYSNWYNYRNNLAKDKKPYKVLSDSITSITAKITADAVGQGAVDYYKGLMADYDDQRLAIYKDIWTSINERKYVSMENEFKTRISDLQNKVNTVLNDAKDNWAKYGDQNKDLEATVKLYETTYNDILANDNSSKRDYYLSQLDNIKEKELDPAVETVKTNYANGEAVKSAVDFAAIQAKINDVLAQQQAGYNAAITADNAAAHGTFVTALGQAKAAYEAAQQARQQYSSSNTEIADALYDAASNFDEIINQAKSDIDKLEKAENAKYSTTTSPTTYSASEFNAQALGIEQNLVNGQETFLDEVGIAISNFWNGKKDGYNQKVQDAEADIASYSADAKKDAFNDVYTEITNGDKAVAANTLAGVENAVLALEEIDKKLTDDKNAAANTDLNNLMADAGTKYIEVKDYIEGVTNDITAKSEQLAILEEAYEDTDAKALQFMLSEYSYDQMFEQHDYIAGILNDFIAKADGCKTAVEEAVAADNANTKAYEAMTAAINGAKAKVATAEALIDQYKYNGTVTFATVTSNLDNYSTRADNYKANGTAVSRQSTVEGWVSTQESQINGLLTAAYNNEKTGLAAELTELKNLYNQYVEKNGVDATANGYKEAIDDLEDQLNAAAIADLDDPADGIDFDDIVAASESLIALQEAIAAQQTAMGADNATVLAALTDAISEMEAKATLDGKDEWVLQQTYNNQTLQEWIEQITEKIAQLKSDVQGEDNLAFYQQKYQDQVDALSKELNGGLAQADALQAQCEANDAAYATLSAQITELQGKIDAAKKKVGAYEYASNDYSSYIEYYSYNYETDAYDILSGGAQYMLNQASEAIETANESKSLDENSVVANKTNIENNIQSYLDNSAYSELIAQKNALSTALTNAIDAKYTAQTYSKALWARLIAEKDGINNKIVDLHKAIYTSDAAYEGSFDEWSDWSTRVYLTNGYYYYYFTLDENDSRISRTKSSDADYAAQMETVAAIKAEIDALSTAVDNLGLLGDANEDGKVNVLDYQKVVNMILDPTLQPEEESDLFTNLDINQSEVIEVGDLTAIVYYILNKNWQGYAAARGMNATSESLSMNASPLSEGKQRIAVSLDNVSAYTAFQMDVVLPEGMTLVGASLTDRAGESHKLYSRAQLDGSIRLLASSVTGETFSGNEGAVLYIDVEGAGNIELLNILFSDMDAQTRSFTIGGEATGIDTVGTFEALKQKVYDLSGRLKDNLKKGFNIIRRADGSTQKVVK